MARIVTYECVQCGTEVVVKEGLEAELSPIYCCGIEVAEISTAQMRAAGPKKAAAAKAKKAAKPAKTAARKIKAAPKKTAARSKAAKRGR